MRTRLKYPDASSKRDHYRDVADYLDSRKKSIQSALTDATTSSPSNYEEMTLEGSYYNTYCQKKDDWLTQHGQIISSFNTFQSDLSICIQNARTLQALWQGRIGVTEEY